MTEVAFGRRRSVDVGGLALALSDGTLGHGWGGWEETEKGETKYAEVLIDVRAHTETVINLEAMPDLSFTALENPIRTRLVEFLGSWNFEPQKLPDEEILACTYVLFEALFRIEGMQERLCVPLSHIAGFLYHLRQVYRQGNTYHNFQHALDVLQATYFFLYSAGMAPPVSILLHADPRTWKRDKDQTDDSLLCCLNNEDLFALLIAAVGHDVGHPGLTNTFMKNAKTPLAVVYDDKSVLEQMHAALILQIMRHNGLGSLLDCSTGGATFRKVLVGTVLGTDMGIHYDFITGFRELISDGETPELRRKVLVCQALIKCADISNPSRPYIVSQHWVTALESEWSSQLLLEKHLRLPESVKPSDNPLSEARGQIWFINTFVRPLFELIAQGIPAMEPFAAQCRENLATWEARSTELADVAPAPHATPPEDVGVDVGSAHRISRFLSAFPPTLPESFRTAEQQPTPSPLFSLPSALVSAPGPVPTSPPLSPHSLSTDSNSSHYHSCGSSPLTPPPPPLLPMSPPATVQLPRLTLATPRSSPELSTATSPSPSFVSTATAPDRTATDAIRAAYNASVRKKKSFYRSSWNPGQPTSMP
ncbi:HD-domain/PDEase-like protein [Sparassis crispa]|uniref:Phosphodiesterase n=1 Tax=Sparassis crispa TaxID=139825 RepID=A0A401GPR9_9APHY|nr:HD-domain/PDEase-like protein [Sparassis crispa]GBE83754.1 HD-domain/PDEase-like protein [Sparassis crispa]